MPTSSHIPSRPGLYPPVLPFGVVRVVPWDDGILEDPGLLTVVVEGLGAAVADPVSLMSPVLHI